MLIAQTPREGRQDDAPPAPAEQASALAALVGIGVDPTQRHDVAMVAMIAQAKSRGITWAQIASTIGCRNGAEAKRAAKRYARSAQAALLRQEIGSAGG